MIGWQLSKFVVSDSSRNVNGFEAERWARMEGSIGVVWGGGGEFGCSAGVGGSGGGTGGVGAGMVGIGWY